VRRRSSLKSGRWALSISEFAVSVQLEMDQVFLFNHRISSRCLCLVCNAIKPSASGRFGLTSGQLIAEFFIVFGHHSTRNDTLIIGSILANRQWTASYVLRVDLSRDSRWS
jgi:hypothetical protein